jgi:tetratricopeptide (TPR) repeat protein
MDAKKASLIAGALVLLPLYNMAQPDLYKFRSASLMPDQTDEQKAQKKKARYGPSLEWLDRMTQGDQFANDPDQSYRKLDFKVMSSMMLAGMASGFKSQVANLLWMKSDEFWHKGLMERQLPIMEMVVTLDPQFIEAWSTTGWHWAYNIFAERPTQKQFKTPREVNLRQNKDVEIGLEYLERGARLNPETYRLWFEAGYHRIRKGGIYDEKAVELLREARKKEDARLIEVMIQDPKTKEVKPVKEQGFDLVGRNIGHIYEELPNFDKALDHYSSMMVAKNGKEPTPQERRWLDVAGEAWGLYGPRYDEIVQLYQDPAYKAPIRALIPNIDDIAKGHAMRQTMAERDSQAVGAYVSITARYLPAWKLIKAGKLQEAERTVIGVMNTDIRYHMQKIGTFAQVLEMKGDAPAAVQQAIGQIADAERQSAQDIGLHLLAHIYEVMAKKATTPAAKKAALQKAYETWVRSRERNTLNFYAKRNSLLLQDKHNFPEATEIVARVKASRSGGAPFAAPPSPGLKLYPGMPASPADAPLPKATAKPTPAPPPATDEHGHSDHDGHNH